MNSEVKVIGRVARTIEYSDGKIEKVEMPNTVLLLGRHALASSLANSFSGAYNFFISRMIFGDGGTSNGAKRYVNYERTGLFGVTQLSKTVISTVDPIVPTQVTFTTTLLYSDAVGITLNEMALQMNNGDLYSMITFPDLTKTDQMQITFNWSLSFV